MLDLPIEGVIIAVVLSLLIGAAGGFVYASLMGYRKKSKSKSKPKSKPKSILKLRSKPKTEEISR